MGTVETVDFCHARLMQRLRQSDATIEDLARAMASIDGKRDAFDAGRGKSVFNDETGHYAGYVAEMESVIERAVGYARDRKSYRPLNALTDDN